MKVRLRPAHWSPLALAVCLSHCVSMPPMVSHDITNGYSLDSGPSLRRSRQDTRYLENTQVQTREPRNRTEDYPGPAYETPETIATTPPGSGSQSRRRDSASAEPETTAEVKPSDPTPPVTETKPATPEQLPFGMPVPGKKGFVYSPFDKSQMVDVRGIPPGKKVRCPYTSKIFLVP